MKIRADEHISPEIVRAVRELGMSPDWDFSHTADHSGKGASDVSWITAFARDGGKAIISGDGDFQKKPHQMMAVQKTGLIVVHLHSRFCNSRRTMQAAHMLYWWSTIEETVVKSEPRWHWLVPWSFSEKPQLQQITVDYEKSRKKLKRENQRAEKAAG